MTKDKLGRPRINGKIIPYAIVDGKKHCGGCNKNLTLDNFFKQKDRSYYNSQCKSCTKKRFLEWSKKNKDYYKEHAREYYKENPLKIIARNCARSLGIVKTECSSCGGYEHLEFHHQDYSNPKDVIVLCRVCHRNYHKLLKKND